MHEEFERAVDAIYETVDADAWPEALDRVAALLGRDTAAFLGFEDIETLDGWHVANGRIEAGAAELFCAACKKHAADFFRRTLPRFPIGEFVPLSRFFEPAVFRSTPVYDGLRQPPAPEDELFAVLRRSPAEGVQFGIVNRDARRSFTSNDRALMTALVPHLCRAARIQYLLARHGERERALEQALDNSPLATLLLDEQGAIVLVNSPAEGILEQGDGISQRAGMLCITDGDAHARCARLLEQAARQPAAFDDEDVLVVRRPSGRQAYVLRVTPLRIPSVAHGGPAISAAVTIADPVLPTFLDSGDLQAALRLSPAEARVAAAFAATGSIGKTAAMLSISVNTVKTHISRILTQTGTCRQADLMRLLMQIAPALQR